MESTSNAHWLPPGLLLAALLLKSHFLPCSLSVSSHSLLAFISNDFFFLQNLWLESSRDSSPTSWAICGHAGGKELMGIVICVYKPHPLLYFIWVFQNITDGGVERVKCYDKIMYCYSKKHILWLLSLLQNYEHKLCCWLHYHHALQSGIHKIQIHWSHKQSLS